MGFLDKAKKMAEQAQAKLDEVQGQFNAGQPGHEGGGPVTEYDKHGRPVTPDPAAPVSAAPPVAETPGVPPTEPAQPTPPAAGPTPDPSAPATPAAPPAEDPNRAPKLSSGDPLAG